MYKFTNISLKRSFSVLFGFQLFLIVVLGILIFSLYQNQIKLAKSRDTNFNSYKLADELRQSSDDLTRMARAFVATGNSEFERNYQTILDIRNGKVPRPVDYDRVYWDFVDVAGKKPRPDGEAVSLHDLMVKEGFTEAEFQKLALAQKNSDDLVKAETIAMNATKGLFDDENGNFTIKKEPDSILANKLMNDENYYKAKAEIMQPIDDFYVMFENRTGGEVAKYLKFSNILFFVIALLAAFVMIMSGYSYIVVGQQITKREQSEKDLVDLQKNLEIKVETRTKQLELSEAEIRRALQESERLNNLMVGRELMMVKLKEELNTLKKSKSEL